MVQIVRRTGHKRKPIQLTIPIEEVEYNHKEVSGRICTFDTETDPFLDGRIVAPFTCGHYFTDTGEYWEFWGDDCIEQYITRLHLYNQDHPEEPLSIFVHNGGNFDFYFMTEYIDNNTKPFIINGRLVRIQICGHEFRDSYSMIPVALGEYEKDKIDYRCMERDFREVFRPKISEYMKKDCTALGDLVKSWLDMFGNRLTMAGVALPMLRSHHGFETFSERTDKEFRPYYFGGRVQCFATGVLEGNFHVYDINSSYPNVMRKYLHPISDLPIYESKITERTDFAHIRAWSLGALPMRADDGSLSFPIGTFDFYACIHEINAGLATGTLRIKKVYSSVYFQSKTTFAEFIDKFYALRIAAGDSGDEIRKLFYKLVMNSSYGKFAQDPRKYENYLFNPTEVPTPLYCGPCHEQINKPSKDYHCSSCEEKTTSPHGWYLHTANNGMFLYASPQRVTNSNFFNVATAASITSAARAELLLGIQASTRPVYCDTDSIICEGIDETQLLIDDKKLGGWKLEKSGDRVAIAGKKMYAVFNQGEAIKTASKGVKLTADEIMRVANGDCIEYANPVPKFKLDGEHQFITRRIRATA